MRLAAQNGHAKAQYHYALMLQYGKGVGGGEPRVADRRERERRSEEAARRNRSQPLVHARDQEQRLHVCQAAGVFGSQSEEIRE